MEKYPEWYTSTQGPQVSMTIKAILGLSIPALKQLFGLDIDNEMINNLVDAGLIAIFACFILYGNWRARKTYSETLGKLQSEVNRLGGANKQACCPSSGAQCGSGARRVYPPDGEEGK